MRYKENAMTKTIRNATFGLLAGAVIAAGAAGAYAATQDQNTSQTPPPFMGRGPGGRGGPGGPMGMLPMLPREIQLTDAQRAQLRTIAEAHRDEWKALADRERSARQALDAAVNPENLANPANPANQNPVNPANPANPANPVSIDESLIRQRSADVAAADADLAVARAHAHAEVWQILTADQKAKLQQLKAAFSARRPSPRGQH
jgi:Spy/CpxP family protein refolding chaperone